MEDPGRGFTTESTIFTKIQNREEILNRKERKVHKRNSSGDWQSLFYVFGVAVIAARNISKIQTAVKLLVVYGH